ncbi:YuzD family protein [Cytobacillus sp. IB215316]|uniref:YuzD family protein n=1 Tax=Cytobacillus sp. IB215316 TaxID=3097354 RepID=UPI002A0E57C4|nr:YuzD family protein [Cytobacillus sp. IB215316]MDX8360870.1 YuzD family protein [Cytobacillus sp. IB215316]
MTILQQVEVCVYGTEVLCPSCVNLPSSKETYEWLDAAITRKFPNQPFTISYVDIYAPPSKKDKQSFATRVIEEDMFYPVVVINDNIVGEGNPKLKAVFEEMEKYGYQQG